MQLRRICIFLAGVSGLGDESYEVESVPAFLERRQRFNDEESRHGNRTLVKGLHLLTSQQRSRLQTELEQILGPLLQQYAQNSTASALDTQVRAAAVAPTASPFVDLAQVASTTDASSTSSLSSSATSTSTGTTSTDETTTGTEFTDLTTTDDILDLGASTTDTSSTASSSTGTLTTTSSTAPSSPSTLTSSTSLTTTPSTASSSSSALTSSSSLTTTLITASSSPSTLTSSTTPLTTRSTTQTTSSTTAPVVAGDITGLSSSETGVPASILAPLTYAQIAFASRFVPTPSSILNIAVSPTSPVNFEQLISTEARLRKQLMLIREWILALTGADLPSMPPVASSTTHLLAQSSTTSEYDLVENLLAAQNALLDVLHNIGEYIEQSDSPLTEFERFSPYVTEVITQIKDTWQAIAANLVTTSTTAAPTTTQMDSTITSLPSSQTSTRVFTTTFLDNTTTTDAEDPATMSCLDLTRTWLASALSNLTRVRITVDQDLTQALIKYTDLRATGLTSGVAAQLTEELGNAVQLCTKLTPESFVIKLGLDENDELLLHTETSDPEALEDIISVLTFSE